MRGLAMCALGSLLAACGPRPTPVPAGTHDSTGTVGVVRVVGSAPMNTRVVIDRTVGEGRVTVEGPLAAELRRLSGVEVEAWGSRTPSSVRVERYRVRSVDGAPVQEGIVEADPRGGLRLRTATGVVRLTGGVSELRPGQRVWVQGEGAMTVQSYGIIRP